MERDQIAELPKVELHCHLDGSVSMELLQELANQQQMDLDELKKVPAPRDCKDLKEYLQGFEVILALLQTSESIQQATYDVIRQAAAEKITYIELRIAPKLHGAGGLSIGEVIEAVDAGRKRGKQDFDTEVGLLICGMKHHTNEENRELFQRILFDGSLKELVCGFDLAGDEAAHPTKESAGTFEGLDLSEMGMTLHAGECGCAQNVADSILLGAKRIGHGIAIMEDQTIADFSKQSDVLFELCPTSNLQTKAVASYADFPIQRFLSEGIKCCLNTDNRTVSQTTLTEEYYLMFQHCGLTLAQMEQMNLDGLAYSFAKEETKERLAPVIKAAYDELSEEGSF